VSRIEHGNLVSPLMFCSSLSDVDWAALNWDDMGIDWASAYAAGQHTSTTAAPAPTTTAVAPVATTTAAAPATTHANAASADSGGIFNEVKSAFSGLVGMANGLKEFGLPTVSSGSEVGAIGNIGDAQGSNMFQCDSTAGQDFTITFINTSGAAMTIVIWNKAYSPTGKAADAVANLGASMAPKHPALTINLAPGEKGIAAFMAGTQGAFAQATDRIAASGAYATCWGEFNFLSGGSGYDMSAIMNSLGNTYSMTMTSEEAPQCTSDPTQNYWTTDTGTPAGTPIAIGDSNGSCFIAQSTAHLTVKMGGDM
jgi:hypothetical protein